MKRKILSFVAALALAGFGTVALLTYVQSAKDEAVAGETLVDVFVLTETVAAHTPLSEFEHSLEAVGVPQRVVVDGAVRDLDSVGADLVAAVELRAGEQLLASRLVDGRQLTRADVPAGLQELTIALDPERAVGGALAAGDKVGVVLSFEPFEVSGDTIDPRLPPPLPADEDEESETADAFSSADGDDPSPESQEDAPTADAEQTPNMSHLTFHKVLVTGVQFDQEEEEAVVAADDPAGQDQQIGRAPSNQLLVTLALAAPQVEQVVFAAEFGHIWLTADGDGASEDGTRIVTLAEAYDATEVPR